MNKQGRKAGKESGIRLRKLPAFLPSLFIPLLFLWFLPSEIKADLTVASAISMGDALEEISRNYSAATGEKIRHTFAGTNVLARQIEAGAPIDVFVSADTATMDVLRQKELVVDSTIRSVARNGLVVVVPNGSKLTELLSAKRIAIADPASVPAGIYAKKWLEAEGIWAEVKPRTIPLQNVRAALLAVETSNADAGIVYRTDALSNKKVKIVLLVPAEKTGAIAYSAALVSASSRQKEAQRFLMFLTSETATEIFIKHGFGKP